MVSENMLDLILVPIKNMSREQASELRKDKKRQKMNSQEIMLKRNNKQHSHGVQCLFQVQKCEMLWIKSQLD